MARAVYIGGFGNGRSSAEAVANALSDQYDDVDPFTFSYAIDNPDKVRRAAQRADAYTHSAGLLALQEAARESVAPLSIVSFAAPIPTSRRHLVQRTLVKTAHMHMPGRGIKSAGDVLSVARYDASATAELTRHPVANLRQLGHIASFDAIGTAASAVEAGIGATLAYNENDDYFQPTCEQRHVAVRAGVEMLDLPGEHDEFVLRPPQQLAHINGTA